MKTHTKQISCPIQRKKQHAGCDAGSQEFIPFPLSHLPSRLQSSPGFLCIQLCLNTGKSTNEPFGRFKERRTPEVGYIPLALQPYREILLVRGMLEQRITTKGKKKQYKTECTIEKPFLLKDGAGSEKQMERK